MDLATKNYREAQFFRLAPLPLTEANYPDGFDLQFSSTFGKTNFLRITAEQMSAIEKILLGAD